MNTLVIRTSAIFRWNGYLLVAPRQFQNLVIRAATIAIQRPDLLANVNQCIRLIILRNIANEFNLDDLVGRNAHKLGDLRRVDVKFRQPPTPTSCRKRISSRHHGH